MSKDAPPPGKKKSPFKKFAGRFGKNIANENNIPNAGEVQAKEAAPSPVAAPLVNAMAGPSVFAVQQNTGLEVVKEKNKKIIKLMTELMDKIKNEKIKNSEYQKDSTYRALVLIKDECEKQMLQSPGKLVDYNLAVKKAYESIPTNDESDIFYKVISLSSKGIAEKLNSNKKQFRGLLDKVSSITGITYQQPERKESMLSEKADVVREKKQSKSRSEAKEDGKEQERKATIKRYALDINYNDEIFEAVSELLKTQPKVKKGSTVTIPVKDEKGNILKDDDNQIITREIKLKNSFIRIEISPAVRNADGTQKSPPIYKTYALAVRKVHGILGEGAYGRVKLAQDKDGHDYAVKIEGRGRRGEDDAELKATKAIGFVKGEESRKLEQPKEFKGKEIDEKLYTMMDLKEGSEFFNELYTNALTPGELYLPGERERKSETLDEVQKYIIAIKCCQAILELHHRGVVHADVKPANFMSDIHGHVIVMSAIDYGFSFKLENGQLKIEHKGIPRGTHKEYMPPEVKKGDTESPEYTNELAEFSFASDIYSLGKMLREDLQIPNSVCQLMLKTNPQERESLPNIIKALNARLGQKIQELPAANRKDALAVFNEIDHGVRRIKENEGPSSKPTLIQQLMSGFRDPADYNNKSINAAYTIEDYKIIACGIYIKIPPNDYLEDDIKKEGFFSQLIEAFNTLDDDRSKDIFVHNAGVFINELLSANNEEKYLNDTIAGMERFLDHVAAKEPEMKAQVERLRELTMKKDTVLAQVKTETENVKKVRDKEKSKPRSKIDFDNPAMKKKLAHDLKESWIDIIKQINISELYEPGNFSKKEKSPTVSKLPHFFNELSYMVSKDILSASNTDEQRKIFEFYLGVIEQCVENKDYGSVFALFSAMQSSPIGRLEYLREGLEERIEKILTLTSTNASSKEIRKACAEAEKKGEFYIPYPGLMMTDLTFASDGNPTIVRNKNNENKVMMQGSLINNFRKLQEKALNIEPKPQQTNFAERMAAYQVNPDAEDKLYARSLGYQSRKPLIVGEIKSLDDIKKLFTEEVIRTQGVIQTNFKIEIDNEILTDKKAFKKIFDLIIPHVGKPTLEDKLENSQVLNILTSMKNWAINHGEYKGEIKEKLEEALAKHQQTPEDMILIAKVKLIKETAIDKYLNEKDSEKRKKIMDEIKATGNAETAYSREAILQVRKDLERIDKLESIEKSLLTLHSSLQEDPGEFDVLILLSDYGEIVKGLKEIESSKSEKIVNLAKELKAKIENSEIGQGFKGDIDKLRTLAEAKLDNISRIYQDQLEYRNKLNADPKSTEKEKEKVESSLKSINAALLVLKNNDAIKDKVTKIQDVIAKKLSHLGKINQFVQEKNEEKKNDLVRILIPFLNDEEPQVKEWANEILNKNPEIRGRIKELKAKDLQFIDYALPKIHQQLRDMLIYLEDPKNLAASKKERQLMDSVIIATHEKLNKLEKSPFPDVAEQAAKIKKSLAPILKSYEDVKAQIRVVEKDQADKEKKKSEQSIVVKAGKSLQKKVGKIIKSEKEVPETIQKLNEFKAMIERQLPKEVMFKGSMKPYVDAMIAQILEIKSELAKADLTPELRSEIIKDYMEIYPSIARMQDPKMSELKFEINLLILNPDLKNSDSLQQKITKIKAIIFDDKMKFVRNDMEQLVQTLGEIEPLRDKILQDIAAKSLNQDNLKALKGMESTLFGFAKEEAHKVISELIHVLVLSENSSLAKEFGEDFSAKAKQVLKTKINQIDAVPEDERTQRIKDIINYRSSLLKLDIKDIEIAPVEYSRMFLPDLSKYVDLASQEDYIIQQTAFIRALQVTDPLNKQFYDQAAKSLTDVRDKLKQSDALLQLKSKVESLDKLEVDRRLELALDIVGEIAALKNQGVNITDLQAQFNALLSKVVYFPEIESQASAAEKKNYVNDRSELLEAFNLSLETPTSNEYDKDVATAKKAFITKALSVFQSEAKDLGSLATAKEISKDGNLQSIGYLENIERHIRMAQAPDNKLTLPMILANIKADIAKVELIANKPGASVAKEVAVKLLNDINAVLSREENVFIVVHLEKVLGRSIKSNINHEKEKENLIYFGIAKPSEAVIPAVVPVNPDEGDKASETAKNTKLAESTYHEMLSSELAYIRDLYVIDEELFTKICGIYDNLSAKELKGCVNKEQFIKIYTKLVEIRAKQSTVLESMYKQDPNEWVKGMTELKQLYKDYFSMLSEKSEFPKKVNEATLLEGPLFDSLNKPMLDDSGKQVIGKTGLTLQSYLIKPLQRPLKYPLLFRELNGYLSKMGGSVLLKTTDTQPVSLLAKASIDINAYAEELNYDKAVTDDTLKLNALFSKYTKKQIDEPFNGIIDYLKISKLKSEDLIKIFSNFDFTKAKKEHVQEFLKLALAQPSHNLDIHIEFYNNLIDKLSNDADPNAVERFKKAFENHKKEQDFIKQLKSNADPQVLESTVLTYLTNKDIPPQSKIKVSKDYIANVGFEKTPGLLLNVFNSNAVDAPVRNAIARQYMSKITDEGLKKLFFSDKELYLALIKSSNKTANELKNVFKDLTDNEKVQFHEMLVDALAKVNVPSDCDALLLFKGLEADMAFVGKDNVTLLSLVQNLSKSDLLSSVNLSQLELDKLFSKFSDKALFVVKKKSAELVEKPIVVMPTANECKAAFDQFMEIPSNSNLQELKKLMAKGEAAQTEIKKALKERQLDTQFIDIIINFNPDNKDDIESLVKRNAVIGPEYSKRASDQLLIFIQILESSLAGDAEMIKRYSALKAILDKPVSKKIASSPAALAERKLLTPNERIHLEINDAISQRLMKLVKSDPTEIPVDMKLNVLKTMFQAAEDEMRLHPTYPIDIIQLRKDALKDLSLEKRKEFDKSKSIKAMFKNIESITQMQRFVPKPSMNVEQKKMIGVQRVQKPPEPPVLPAGAPAQVSGDTVTPTVPSATNPSSKGEEKQKEVAVLGTDNLDENKSSPVLPTPNVLPSPILSVHTVPVPQNVNAPVSTPKTPSSQPPAGLPSNIHGQDVGKDALAVNQRTWQSASPSQDVKNKRPGALIVSQRHSVDNAELLTQGTSSINSLVQFFQKEVEQDGKKNFVEDKEKMNKYGVSALIPKTGGTQEQLTLKLYSEPPGADKVFPNKTQDVTVLQAKNGGMEYSSKEPLTDAAILHLCKTTVDAAGPGDKFKLPEADTPQNQKMKIALLSAIEDRCKIQGITFKPGVLEIPADAIAPSNTTDPKLKARK